MKDENSRPRWSIQPVAALIPVGGSDAVSHSTRSSGENENEFSQLHDKKLDVCEVRATLENAEWQNVHVSRRPLYKFWGVVGEAN